MIEFLLIIIALFAWRICVHLAHIHAELKLITASNREVADAVAQRDFLLSDDTIPRTRTKRGEIRPMN